VPRADFFVKWRDLFSKGKLAVLMVLAVGRGCEKRGCPSIGSIGAQALEDGD